MPEAVPASEPEPIHPARLRRVDRILGEIRRGTPVVLRNGGRAALVAAVETSGLSALTAFAPAVGASPEIVLTRQRAERLGLGAATAAVAVAGRDLTDTDVVGLADPGAPDPLAVTHGLSPREAGSIADAALQATKLARLLPAVLQVHLQVPDPAAWAAEHDLLMADVADVAAYRPAIVDGLREVAAARVPLAGAEHTRIHAFRPADGGEEQLAVVIGDPSPDTPVLTRLHSECLTGDLLGSLRCDCGDQLRGAIDAIAAEGAGVLLYLAQEGRGIGLVNKLRAYRQQDAGADTLDANAALGFDADERRYAPAAAMLTRMGFTRVRLMTNNPEKVTALTEGGITVTERVPHRFPANPHSAAYLATKTARFGHLS